MKHGFIKVAAVSPQLKVADVPFNTSKILEKIDEAAKEKAKIVVFPELCITGYTCGDLFLQRTLIKAAKEALREIIDYTTGMDMLVFVGLPMEKNHKLYDVAAAICDGQLLALIPKTYGSGFGEYAESRYFAKGNAVAETMLFECDGEMEEIPFGTHILLQCDAVEELVVGCELGAEVENPMSPATFHALAGATVIVNLSAASAGVGKEEKLMSLLEVTSRKLACAYIMANAGSGESTQDIVMSGCNAIYENGELLSKNERFTYNTVYSEIDVQKLTYERVRKNTYEYTENNDYILVNFGLEEDETVLTRKIQQFPFVPETEEIRNSCMEEILEIQARGLMQRMAHVGAKAAVLGISGGLDSTLALLVTAKAFDLLGLPREGICAITMPCFGTTDRTYENACMMSKVLGASLREIDIKEAVTVHFKDIEHDMDIHNVTYENAQARERTQVLMDIANEVNGLVIGTGDFSELALGWATYNGDHMSMYGVNGNVPKTLLRHLVRYYADTCNQEELKNVLYDVLDTPVSPELLPPVDGKIAQKTEDLVGPYELHDFVMYYVLRYGFSPSKIYRLEKYCWGQEYDEETIKKWLKTFFRRFFTQQFKRSCLPDGAKVFDISVSPRGDLRMPSDASSTIWVREVEQL